MSTTNGKRLWIISITLRNFSARAQEDFRREQEDSESGLPRYESLLLRINKTEKFDLAIIVEGSELDDVKQYEKDLNLLERGNLINRELTYRDRNTRALIDSLKEPESVEGTL